MSTDRYDVPLTTGEQVKVISGIVSLVLPLLLLLVFVQVFYGWAPVGYLVVASLLLVSVVLRVRERDLES